jgi:tRNA nucleotidyltransferase (CCA-adding enzyme)
MEAQNNGVCLHQKVLEEKQLFELLVNAAEAHEQGKLTIDPNPPRQSVNARGGFTKAVSVEDGPASWLSPPPKVDRIEIRIAGGWVRDKLLNQHSSDVDVALNCMMGVQFARIVQSYMAQQSQEMDDEDMEDGSKKGKGKKPQKQPKIGVIGANPSQSKHLETATMNIHGIDIDFVNLRAEEVYEENSRIPTSETRMFGTPLEDAVRRDFTINSLFYNIRTHKIEDWTGRGLDDLLKHRRIVTPIDAHETFHDDPLRVLRAIRFCVRLDFVLDGNLKEAAMSKRVHHSLHVKVSRERVGKELEGMMSGKGARPGCALNMIADLHLAGSVFCFPGSFPGDHDFLAGGPVTGHILGVRYHGCLGKDCPEAVELAARHRKMGWDESRALLDVLPNLLEGYYSLRESIIRERRQAGEDGLDILLPSTVDERLLYLCVFMLPFHNLSFPDAKGRESSVTAHMIKESLKFATRDIQAISTILNQVDETATLLTEVRTQLASQHGEEGKDGLEIKLTPPCRLRTGLLLRLLKDHWVTCLLTSAAWEIRSCQRANAKGDAPDKQSTSIAAEQPSLEFYRSVIQDLALDECWRVTPHLNGKEIISELQLPRGPAVGIYIEDQLQWMLLNPNGTREECVTHLHERKRARELESSSNGEGIVEEDEHKRQCVKVLGRQ